MKAGLLIVCLCMVQIGFGQSELTLDSLKKQLRNDKTHLKTLNKLSVLYQTVNSDSSLLYARKALEHSKKENDKAWISKSYSSLGVSYWYKSKLDSAKYCFEKSLSYNQPIRDSILWAKMQSNLGILADNAGDLDIAINKYNKGLTVYLQLKDSVNIYKTYSNLALLYSDLGKNEEALQKNKAALNIAERIKNQQFISILHNNIGLNLISLKEYDQALTSFLRGYSIAVKEKNKVSEAILLGNIGFCYLRKKKYALSEQKLKMAIRLNNDLKQTNYLITNLIHLSDLAAIDGQLDKGVDYINQAKILCKRESNLHTYISLLKKEGEFLFETKKYKEACKIKDEYILTNDSIKSKSFVKQLAELENQYQTQQKENEILELSNKNIQQEAALVESRNTLLTVLIFVGLLVGVGYFFWTRRKHQYQLALLENSVKSSEAEKSRIGKELHDSIANSVMKLVHESEKESVTFSHKLLEAYNNIRNLSHRLDNSPMHGELFLDRALDCIPQSSSTQKFNFELQPRNLQLNEPQGTHVFRILQELVANNLKHAKASQTDINLVLEKGFLHLSYKDNGVGVSPFKKGRGFKNMEDRIQLMKGSLTYNNKQNNGFDLTISVPYS